MSQKMGAKKVTIWVIEGFIIEGIVYSIDSIPFRF